MSDIDTADVDSLKVLDPKRPIREADIPQSKVIEFALQGKTDIDETADDGTAAKSAHENRDR